MTACDLPEAAEQLDSSLDAVDALEAADALVLDHETSAQHIEVPVELASGWQVLLALAVDAIAALMAGIVVASAEIALFSPPWRSSPTYVLDLMADWLHVYQGPALRGVIAAVAVGLTVSLVAGRRGGRTLGRRLTGTVLVRASGHRLSWFVVVVRSLVSLISLACFGAGFFWAIVDSRHRTWHDRVVGTVVVRRRVRL
jgi:uncharacterized RDD family membrane protein YckC